MTGHGRNLIVGRVNGIMLVEFARADLIDSEYLAVIDRELRELVQGEECPRIVIDFEEVRFLSSAAMEIIINVHNLVTQRGGTVRLANVVAEVRSVLEIVNLPDLVPTFGSREEALRSLEG